MKCPMFIGYYAKMVKRSKVKGEGKEGDKFAKLIRKGRATR
ncbi:MAG: hypothetical protein AABX01_00845 [Candidatus Micrarchaeota archaeon]